MECTNLKDFLSNPTAYTSLNFSDGNTKLEEKIEYSNGKIGPIYLDLYEKLESNATITSLNLSNNQITNSQFSYLGKMLESNTTITSLNLSKTNISPINIMYLSDALKINTTLKSLDRKRQILCI